MFAFMFNAVYAEDSRHCGTKIPTIIKEAYPYAIATDDGRFKAGNVMIDTTNSERSIICRIWPANPELTLAAVPLMYREEDFNDKGDIELLVLDSLTLNIKYRLRLKDRLNDDAVQIRSIELDTARYKITENMTAFGIRISAANNSQPNPFTETNLWLYVIDGKELRPILDGMTVSQSYGEWDTDCAGEFHDSKIVLSMGPSIRNEYADVVATETGSTRIATIDSDGTCKDNTVKSKPKKFRMAYDEKQYLVPTDRQVITAGE